MQRGRGNSVTGGAGANARASRRAGAVARARAATAADPDLAQRAARSRALPFVAAIALSSFALFCLELIAGQVVQPVFGGAPAVWATTLCFFTAVLFLGYLYGHAVITRLPVRLGVALHLGVAVVAVIAAIAAPSRVGSLRIAGLADAPTFCWP
jgi:hypothetical protein